LKSSPSSFVLSAASNYRHLPIRIHERQAEIEGMGTFCAEAGQSSESWSLDVLQASEYQESEVRIQP